jgi:dual specificity tyrosine-phosphorylation-regulated kinase 2/3/4
VSVHHCLQIWFLGKADVQKIKGNPHLQKTNYGYDDERGDYHVTPRDHIAYRYEVQSVLGKGSFGQVLKVLDYKTGSYKALKVIRNKKRFHHQVRICWYSMFGAYAAQFTSS